MKPRPYQAMQTLIQQIRQAIPFNIPESSLCLGPCLGCSKKLIEFLDDELCDWQAKLAQGVEPNLGEIHRLARTAKKIYKVLKANGFITENYTEKG